MFLSAGSTAAKQRQEVWKTKRVFFLTPQVMVNDLSRETCPAKQIKCVVIDEAHKALGNHAYCQVHKPVTNVALKGGCKKSVTENGGCGADYTDTIFVCCPLFIVTSLTRTVTNLKQRTYLDVGFNVMEYLDLSFL